MSDRIKAIAREVRVQQQIFKNHGPTADMLELEMRSANEKMVVLIDRIEELEEGIRIVVSKYDNDITTAADMADELEALLPEKDDGS